ncbi:MAG TPA: septation protein A [Hyphomicrobiaceae bacterium]|nr:septation protein A [Hyphomicrobiaceae bacterium]
MHDDAKDHTKPPENLGPQMLKLGLEIGPLVIFFLSNSWYGIQLATKTFMIATLISLVLSRWLLGKIAMMPLVTAVFVMIFGGLTVWLEDDLFIKLKPTIVNLFFGATLFGGLLFGKSPIKYVFADAFHLTDTGWRILTQRWGFFFILLAALNEIVWRNFSTDSWVAFKTFGIMPLTMIFAISQIGTIKQHELTYTNKAHDD